MSWGHDEYLYQVSVQDKHGDSKKFNPIFNSAGYGFFEWLILFRGC
jgi:hypothetical protein